MSIKVSSWVWENSPYKASDLLVLLALADNAHDDGGGAYPSVTTLIKKTRMSKRTIQYALKSMVADGALECQYGAGPNGVNIYKVVMDPEGCKDCTVQNTTPGGAIDAEGVQSTTQGGADFAPKPSVTISKNRNKSSVSFFDFLDAKKLEFPEIDVDTEWAKCQLWWAKKPPKKNPNWELRLFNWLINARKHQKEKPQPVDEWDLRIQRGIEFARQANG